MPGLLLALIGVLVWLVTGSILLGLVVALILAVVGWYGWGYYGSHYGHRRPPP